MDCMRSTVDFESLSLVENAILVLSTPDTDTKSSYTLKIAKLWRDGRIHNIFPGTPVPPPTHPGRPDHIEILEPHLMPKRGRGGTLANRIAMIHALVHIESVAIDLSWDIIARFQNENFPREFYDDWVKVAEDEAKHYAMLSTRIKEMGSHYGALPAHDGLWESAIRTADSILARLAIEHMVHEARGLDVTPKTIARLRSGGDKKSADLLEKSILPDEITHVAAGIKWFTYICERESLDPIDTFIETVPNYFRGKIKAPFNKEAREIAGMTEEWYIPLT
eukprot:TRINITY_DN6301_c0_g1_i1.p1 TRINITY_DN6301_c0_g1~~TRINITY_DN6301_c0_g1_i1.p1  ORF type:complete len:279 (-),score=50.72 TRINITY_DN6301_c0_g1_i1:851-1687(-)